MTAHAALRRTLPLVLVAGLLFPTGTVSAHGGGTPQLTNAAAGPYRVYVWTRPEPVRVGEMHASIVVTLPFGSSSENGSEESAQEGLTQAIRDADVTVRFVPTDSSVSPMERQATPQQDAAGYFYEVDTELPAHGDWRIEVSVAGELGRGTTDFLLAVRPANTLNWPLIGAVTTAVLGFLFLFGMRSRMQKPAESGRNQRRTARRQHSSQKS